MPRKARHLEAPDDQVDCAQPHDERAYQAQAASELLGVSKGTIWNLLQTDPAFPAPRKMGTVTFWLRSELVEYIRSRPITRSAEVHKLKLQETTGS
jgi:predicted DNA-binding transcriptional regulator AlpA